MFDYSDDVYALVNPRAYLDDSYLYQDALNGFKGSSTKEGRSIKAIRARRKKNKNKKTHRK